MGHECNCEEEECEGSCCGINIEEIVASNNLVLNALIDLMIEQKILTEKDLMTKIKTMQDIAQNTDYDKVEKELKEIEED